MYWNNSTKNSCTANNQATRVKYCEQRLKPHMISELTIPQTDKNYCWYFEFCKLNSQVWQCVSWLSKSNPSGCIWIYQSLYNVNHVGPLTGLYVSIYQSLCNIIHVGPCSPWLLCSSNNKLFFFWNNWNNTHGWN